MTTNNFTAFKGAFGFTLLLVLVVLVNACQPISSFKKPVPYKIIENFELDYPAPKHGLKNIILIADNKSTELFDLIGPFYLFSLTNKANIFIVAKQSLPITLFRGLSVLPHHTFESFSKLNINPDLIIIPNLSTIQEENIDQEIVSFINKQYNSENTSILSVCDGAATAVLTGLYDNAPITAHSSDIDRLNKQHSGINWVRNLKVTQHNNLYSTAGVANATEGSLIVIKKMFGSELANEIAKQINLPYQLDSLNREPQYLSFNDKTQILKKVLFKKNKNLGFLIYQGISEFDFAALLDTYSRTFPNEINSFSIDGNPVRSLHGLTFIPTTKKKIFDEIHIVQNEFELESITQIKGKRITHTILNEYIFDYGLSSVENDYGLQFRIVTQKLLDYESH